MTNKVKRITGLVVIECRRSNPNGDPDALGAPRQTADGHGLISAVSIKRKIRDIIEDKSSMEMQTFGKNLDPSLYEIMETAGRSINDQAKLIDSDVDAFLSRYYDARLFGTCFLYTPKGSKKGIQVGRKAALVIGDGFSVAPVEINVYSQTRKSQTTDDKESGFAPMCHKVVQHGVYCVPFISNPWEGDKNNCSQDDIELALACLATAYQSTASAARPDVAAIRIWVVEHENRLISFRDSIVQDLLCPRAKSVAPRSIEDYEIPDASALNGIRGIAAIREIVEEQGLHRQLKRVA